MDFRPHELDEFIGQEETKTLLKLEIQAFRHRQQQSLLGRLDPRDVPMRHIVLTGSSGLGKSTLAGIISAELGVKLIMAGPASLTDENSVISLLQQFPADWYDKKILNPLPGIPPKPCVVFIDEAHLLRARIQDLLLTAMEEFIFVSRSRDYWGKQRQTTYNVSEWCGIFATNHPMDLTEALRSRCMSLKLEPYCVGDLTRIASNYMAARGVQVEPGVCEEIARRARMTSRTAIRLCDSIANAAVAKESTVTMDTAIQYFALAGIDAHGLTRIDRAILGKLSEMGVPLGLKTLSSLCLEAEETIEGMYEPYLLASGLIVRCPRGRMITNEGVAVVEEGTCRKS